MDLQHKEACTLWRVPLAVCLGLSCLAQGGAASAQDWETTEPFNRVKLVTIGFDNGIGIGFRCERQSLDAMLVGLPPVPAPQFHMEARNIQMSWGRDVPVRTGGWWRTSNELITLTDSPAMLARALRRGGELNIVAVGAGEGGANVRYVVDLPASYEALEGILNACGLALTDPLELDRPEQIGAVVPGEEHPAIVWRHAPRMEYPVTNWSSGVARVNCLTEPSGGLTDCRLEGELPREAGFGRAALRAGQRASVQLADGSGGPVPRTSISFTVRFLLER